MKENEKKAIFGLVIIVAIILLVIIFSKVGKKEENKPQNNTNQTGTSQTSEEFSKVQEDGTRLNTSSKLAETKKIDNLEITNIKLTENGDVSQIIADVKNTSRETKGGYEVKLIFLDKDGKTIKEVPAYLEKAEGGQTVQLNASSSSKLSNAYDFKIEK